MNYKFTSALPTAVNPGTNYTLRTKQSTKHVRFSQCNENDFTLKTFTREQDNLKLKSINHVDCPEVITSSVRTSGTCNSHNKNSRDKNYSRTKLNVNSKPFKHVRFRKEITILSPDFTRQRNRGNLSSARGQSSGNLTAASGSKELQSIQQGGSTNPPLNALTIEKTLLQRDGEQGDPTSTTNAANGSTSQHHEALDGPMPKSTSNPNNKIELKPIQPSPITLEGQPFNPTPNAPMLDKLRARIHTAAQFMGWNSRAPLQRRRDVVPKISPCRYAEAIEIAMSYAPNHVKPDFSAVELFRVSEGSTTSHTQDARDLFELLFVGMGSFPVGCDELAWNEEPLINKNPRNLVVHVGRLPGEDKPKSEVTGPTRLLNLAGEEVTARRYIGPFTVPEVQQKFKEGVVVSQGFIIAKPKAITTAYRLVHNGSSKFGNVNEATTNQGYQVRLDHTSKYLEYVRDQLKEAAEKPLFQVVADVSKCYRRMGTFHKDVPRYGLRVDVVEDGEVPFFSGVATDKVGTKTVKKGQMLVYLDTRLPFGMTSSVTSCVRVTNFLRDLMRELLENKPGTCACYIDDFCLVGQRAVVDEAIALLRGLMERVGLPENVKKMQWVSQLSTYLGIEYDLTVPSMSLPRKKQNQYLKHVRHFLARKTSRIKRSELDSLVGKLAHCAQIFSQAKIYYQRLLAALRAAGQQKNSMVQLGKQEMDDLRWWESLLMEHSGTVILDPEEWGSASTHKIYTDASSSTGYGVMWKGHYFYGQWDERITAAIAAGELDINMLELVCLTMALDTFGHKLKGKRILFRCDNSSCVHNVEKQSSQKELRAIILRRLYVVAAMFGIQLKSTWISTHNNEHADALSRGDLTRFFSLPQNFQLVPVKHPCLQSLDLLTNRHGKQNPSSPEWRATEAATSLDQLFS